MGPYKIVFCLYLRILTAYWDPSGLDIGTALAYLKSMPRDKTISFKVSKALYDRIREKARKSDKSQSDVLRDAVVEYLTEPVKREVNKQREERTEKLYRELTDQWREQVSRLDRIVELLEEGIKKD